MIIKNNMVVICRTQEEQEVYVEIATKEGWKYGIGTTLKAEHKVPMNYTTGYFNEQYPNAITWGIIDDDFPPHLTVIEASSLFKNQIISRRRKHEKRTT